MRELLWSVGAWNDYLELQTDKAALKKVNKLLKDVMRNGYQASYGKLDGGYHQALQCPERREQGNRGN